jgi:hypothetical protein
MGSEALFVQRFRETVEASGLYVHVGMDVYSLCIVMGAAPEIYNTLYNVRTRTTTVRISLNEARKMVNDMTAEIAARVAAKIEASL